MTKEITKAIILQEIQDKFGLREFEPANFLFDEKVVPIYNVGQHLITAATQTKAISITSASGFLFYTVPQNEKWSLRSYELIFGSTGPHKATGLYISRKDTPGPTIYLDMKKGQEVSYLVNLPTLVTLRPGDGISVYFDTYVSTQNLSVVIDYTREIIR